jgi:FtsH-binding integral membrane protein
MSVLSAAAGGYVHVFNILPQLHLLAVFASLGLLIWLMCTPDDGKNRGWRLCILLGFAFASGMGLGPLLDMAIDVNPQLVPTAFLATSFVFISFSLSALLTRDRKWIYIGGTLFSMLSMTFFLGFCFIFFRSLLMYKIHMYLSLIVMCGFILYDTQMIVEKKRIGDGDFIWHSVDLFLDFITVFQYILKILLLKDQQDNRRRRSN